MKRWVLIRVDAKDHKRMKETYRNCKHSFPCSLHYFYRVAVSQYLERSCKLGEFIKDLFESEEGSDDSDGQT